MRGTELPGLKRKDPRWERGLRGGERGFASSAPGDRSSAKRWRTGRPVAGQEQRCSRARLGPVPTAGTKWVGRLFRERQARRNHDPGRSSGFRFNRTTTPSHPAVRRDRSRSSEADWAVARWEAVPDYSGGTATDLHRLPYSSRATVAARDTRTTWRANGPPCSDTHPTRPTQDVNRGRLDCGTGSRGSEPGVGKIVVFSPRLPGPPATPWIARLCASLPPRFGGRSWIRGVVSLDETRGPRAGDLLGKGSGTVSRCASSTAAWWLRCAIARCAVTQGMVGWECPGEVRGGTQCGTRVPAPGHVLGASTRHAAGSDRL